MGVPIRQMSPEDLAKLYPQFSVADMSYATYNPEGGFLRALDCVKAFASGVRSMGGEIREGARLVALEQTKGCVTVTLDGGERLKADRVIVATGAWGATLLTRLGVSLPLTANKQQVVYVAGLGAEFAPGQFPVFLNLDHDFYGFPLDSEGLFKSSIHLPGPVIDPDLPLPPDEEFTLSIVSLLKRYIPRAAQGQVVLARTCMYAMTPDEDFLLDRVAGMDNVVVAAGFSGHGFKFAPLIGDLAAALALGEEPEFSLERFSLNRFRESSERPRRS
jgi:glycine/D-amino acid oxidase-like deaminating enzyme